jgi:predicted RNA-binding Zn-ribbon protein involved in translation (DUF1610 family)
MQPLNLNHKYLQGKVEEIEQTCWKCEHEWCDEYDLEPNLNYTMVAYECPMCGEHWYEEYEHWHKYNQYK